MPIRVVGPTGEDVAAQWLLLPDGTGLVELASTSGITLLEELRPAEAHTTGFGQAIAAALDHGVTRLLLARGGSASTDGGVGALGPLGGRFLDRAGHPIGPGNVGLAALDAVDLSRLRPTPPAGAIVLADVTNPLLGDHGAAAVFGPQKGADPSAVQALEANLHRLVDHLGGDPDVAGAGAAGGTAFGLLRWGAPLTPGSEAVGDVVGLRRAVAEADLVVTGEGRFDVQSWNGKVPGYVAALAGKADLPTLLVAGEIAASTEGLVTAGQDLVSLAGSAAAAIADPLRYLQAAGTALAARAEALLRDRRLRRRQSSDSHATPSPSHLRHRLQPGEV